MQLPLDASITVRGLALQRAERVDLTLAFDESEHALGTDGGDQFRLEVRDAHEAADDVEPIRALLEGTAKRALLALVAQTEHS